MGETMTALSAAKHTPSPRTPPLPQAKPESLGLSSIRLQRMSDAFKRDIDKGTIPGVTMMVARRGQIGWFDALGQQNPASAAPMTHNTIFRIFSMTKPIVSIGIMMLLEEGHFLLNDPVSKYIPEFSSQKVGVENNGKLDLVPLTLPITIQDLLRHTSGITYDHTGNGLVQQLYQQSRLRSRKISNAEHAAIVASLPLMCQPGAEWNYSRSTDILGRIIEIISGKALSAFLTERILAPLQRECGSSCRGLPDRSLDRREGAALQHAGQACHGIRRRRAGLDHNGLRAILPDAAQWRHPRRQQDHRPQDAAADGIGSSRPQGQDREPSGAAGPQLRSRLRGADA
jgi:CubicO group peptidase (beta-lactamase class C family)